MLGTDPNRSGLTAASALIAAEEPVALAELQAYLRIPGFSSSGEGIPESAEAAATILSRVCPNARVVKTAGHPVVYGTRRSHQPGAKTLIIYGLYDMTPLQADEWRIDGLGATILPAVDAGLPAHLGEVLVSRAAHNHRGPFIATVRAVEALVRTVGDVPCHLIFVIEGEEEIGSPSLAGFVAEQLNDLAEADGAWLPCMMEGSDGSMTLHRGFKGAMWFEFTCVGGEWGGSADGRHLWAGHSAWIDAPMMQLLHAVGSLYGPDHRVIIDGLDQVQLHITDEDRRDARQLVQTLAADPGVEAEMKQILGVHRLRGGQSLAELIERFMFSVSLNVQGVSGGWQGPDYYTMLPGRAAAKVDLRVPMGVSTAQVAALVRQHLDRRGFEQVTIENFRAYPAARTSASDPLLAAAVDAAAEHGSATQVMPLFNGCCPATLFQELGSSATELPFSFAGLGQGERPHAPHEFIKTSAVRRLADFTISYLHAWAALPRSDEHARGSGAHDQTERGRGTDG